MLIIVLTCSFLAQFCIVLINVYLIEGLIYSAVRLLIMIVLSQIYQ